MTLIDMFANVPYFFPIIYLSCNEATFDNMTVAEQTFLMHVNAKNLKNHINLIRNYIVQEMICAITHSTLIHDTCNNTHNYNT